MATAAQDIPRPEHPDPQRQRSDWANLNGTWDFAIDAGRNGLEAGWHKQSRWNGQMQILVPFCPESKLSGIGIRDFMPAVWYRRRFAVPSDWKGKRILLHFGAVDFDCRVWVNGKYIGRHTGGYTPLQFDITDEIEVGRENLLVVYVEDDVRSGMQPGGKQSDRYGSYGCHYTRVTGIWQTVWLEAVGQTFIEDLQVLTNPDLDGVTLLITLRGHLRGLGLKVVASLNGKVVAQWAGPAQALSVVPLRLKDVAPWQPGQGILYDLDLQLLDAGGNVVDRMQSYFGLRMIEIQGRKILLNGKPLFLRWVLDQGYWPDGIYTAASEEDLRADIERAMACGFNGARLHQKVFEPRYLYWADRLGFLVAGEMGDWKMNFASPVAIHAFLADWQAAVMRDRNRPSLLMWTPFNETAGRRRSAPDVRLHDCLLRNVYALTKSLDPTRPVIDTSGYVHVITDIYDIHNYEQDPEKFRKAFEALASGKWSEAFRNFPDEDIPYSGEVPYFVSEYGGIWWDPQGEAGEHAWGYGTRPRTPEEFIQRFKGLTETLLGNPNICGFCYTQLYDIEQEANGLYTYRRKPKFEPKVIAEIVSQPAAIEQ